VGHRGVAAGHPGSRLLALRLGKLLGVGQGVGPLGR
jgi:hypothetical protein